MLAKLIHKWRWPNLFLVAVVTGIIALAACGVDGEKTITPVPTAIPAAATPDIATQQPDDRVTVGISMYLLVDDLEDPDPALSSQRTEEELTVILAGMNEIWTKTNIHLELVNLNTIEADPAVLQQVAQGDIRAFLGQLGGSIPFGLTGPDSSLISGFYTKEIGGPNGITPLGTGWYLVMDEPSVFDRRVSSHEVGHILGLRHTLNGRGRLLYPSTNSMSLTQEEITITRYVAMELLKTRK